MYRSPTMVFSDNCPKWLKMQVEASMLLLHTSKEVKDSLDNLPWLDPDGYRHKDHPAKLLAKHNLFVIDDGGELHVVRGEEEVLASVLFK